MLGDISLSSISFNCFWILFHESTALTAIEYFPYLFVLQKSFKTKSDNYILKFFTKVLKIYCQVFFSSHNLLSSIEECIFYHIKQILILVRTIFAEFMNLYIHQVIWKSNWYMDQIYFPLPFQLLLSFLLIT